MGSEVVVSSPIRGAWPPREYCRVGISRVRVADCAASDAAVRCARGSGRWLQGSVVGPSLTQAAA